MPALIRVTREVIDSVDADVVARPMDDFRREELEFLDSHFASLRLVILDLFEDHMARPDGGETSAFQSMIGALFMTRLLREAADSSGEQLPNLSGVDLEMICSRNLQRVMNHDDPEAGFDWFRQIFLHDQKPLVERLDGFQNIPSKASAAVIALYFVPQLAPNSAIDLSA